MTDLAPFRVDVVDDPTRNVSATKWNNLLDTLEADIAQATGGGAGLAFTAAPSDGTAAQSVIMAELAAGDVHLDGTKTYSVTAPIVVPSNRKLHLNGATVRAIAPFATGAAGLNGVISTAAASVAPSIVGPGTIDANKQFFGGSGRLCGFRMSATKGFTVGGTGRILVKNVTGYACWAESPTFSGNCSGTFRGIDVENAEIHYEATGTDGVLFDDITSADGAGDIAVASWMHPLGGAKNVTFSNFRGKGATATAVEITHNVAAMDNIRFLNCIGELTSGGVAFVANGSFGATNVLVDGCRFKSPYVGANLAGVIGRMIGTKIEGGAQGTIVSSGEWDFDGCDLMATHATAFAYALQQFTSGKARVNGGSLTATSPGGAMSYTGAAVIVSRDTRQTPLGGGVNVRIANTSDGTTTSTSPVTLSAAYTPVQFALEANRRYEFLWEGLIAADATTGYTLSLLAANGLTVTSIKGEMQASTSSTAQVWEPILNLSSTMTVGTGTGNYRPARVRFVIVPATAGTIALQYARTGGAGTVYSQGGHVARLEEV